MIDKVELNKPKGQRYDAVLFDLDGTLSDSL